MYVGPESSWGAGPRNDLCSKAIMIMNCDLRLDPKVGSSCASHPDLPPPGPLVCPGIGHQDSPKSHLPVLV